MSAETHASILSLPDLVNNDAALVRRGRYLTATNFYRIDGDFRDRVGQIDTTRCPLYLLTGEYDFSCTPEDTRLTAEKIPGARFTLMTEIGHFPMAENPAQFRRYLLPVLDEIRAAAR
jgi:pimeloyl-ACP methyl ester carboxylesterase